LFAINLIVEVQYVHSRERKRERESDRILFLLLELRRDINNNCWETKFAAVIEC